MNKQLIHDMTDEEVFADMVISIAVATTSPAHSLMIAASVARRLAGPDLRKLVGTLKNVATWLDYWTPHACNCRYSETCTCGLRAIQHEVRAALAEWEKEAP